jgi:hypothetical protein
MMKQMFWRMRCGDEEGVVRSECKMMKSAGKEAEGTGPVRSRYGTALLQQQQQQQQQEGTDTAAMTY